MVEAMMATFQAAAAAAVVFGTFRVSKSELPDELMGPGLSRRGVGAEETRVAVRL